MTSSDGEWKIKSHIFVRESRSPADTAPPAGGRTESRRAAEASPSASEPPAPPRDDRAPLRPGYGKAGSIGLSRNSTRDDIGWLRGSSNRSEGGPLPREVKAKAGPLTQRAKVGFHPTSPLLPRAGKVSLGANPVVQRGRDYSSLGSTAAVWKSPVERRRRSRRCTRRSGGQRWCPYANQKIARVKTQKPRRARSQAGFRNMRQLFLQNLPGASTLQTG